MKRTLTVVMELTLVKIALMEKFQMLGPLPWRNANTVSESRWMPVARTSRKMQRQEKRKIWQCSFYIFLQVKVYAYSYCVISGKMEYFDFKTYLAMTTVDIYKPLREILKNRGMKIIILDLKSLRP